MKNKFHKKYKYQSNIIKENYFRKILLYTTK